MYGKPVEDEIQRIKKGNKRDGEYMLSVDELNELIEKAKNDDNEAQVRIWETHLLFISKKLSTSKYVGTGSRTKLEPDEALGVTWESLLKALQSYNGSSSFSFWWWNKCKIDLESEWRRRVKQNERHPLFSDLFPEAEDETDNSLAI